MRGRATALAHLIAAACFAVLFVCSPVATANAQSRAANPPNIILILADDLGYGDIGAYGSPDIQTPNIDRLATEGVMLNSFYTAPSCSLSRAMLMTGSYAPRASLARNFTPSSPSGIHENEATLGDLLRSAGYVTGIFGKWHLGDHYQYRPQRHGFDEFYGVPHSSDMWPFHPLNAVTANEDPRLAAARARAALTGFAGQGRPFPLGEGFPNLPLYDGDSIVEFNSDQRIFGSAFFDRALDFIERHSGDRFFAYIPLTAPHVPLHPSAAFVGTSARDLYGDTVQEIDSGVGRIFAKLVELGIDDETLVLFLSDNGPWLEYGIDGGSADPFSGGKETQFEGGIRVPALIRWPGELTAGDVIDEPLSLIDILPTLASVANATVPGDRSIDGVDAWPLLTGSAAGPLHPAIFGFDESGFTSVDLGMVRSGDWKLHVWTNAGTVSPLALYDLGSDPAELNNVQSSEPGVVSSLVGLGQAIVNDISADQRPLGTVTLSGEPFAQETGFGDMVVMEAEHFHERQARGGQNWDSVTPRHSSAGESLQALPNIGVNRYQDYVTTAPHLGYRAVFQGADRYYVWVRSRGATSSDNSLNIGLNGQALPSGDRVEDIFDYWSWTSTIHGGGRAYIDVPSAGEHVVDVWMREDGTVIDKLLLTTDANFVPEGQGLVESLQAPASPALTFSNSTLSFSADEGSSTAQSQTVSLTTSDSTAASFTLNAASSGWLSVSPTSGTTPAGTVTVTADPSGLAAGQYSGTITATASGYVEDSIDVTLNVVGDSGSLAASVASTGSVVDLSADGSADWVHWGLTSATSVNRKSGVTPLLSNFQTLGANPRRFQASSNDRATYNWNDGTPTSSASTTAGVYFRGVGNGFELTAAADTSLRTLEVHLGGFEARGRIEISLSDGSVAPFVTTVEDLGGAFDRTVTVTYNATSAGQTLLLRYTLLTGSNITLQAATLDGSPPAAMALPFVDNFNDGNRDGWAIVNETPSAEAWDAASGELSQLTVVESTDSFEESYHLGTYAWLTAGATLTDYVFSVQARRTNPDRPESYGVLFRYRDADNFYRFTLNSRYGFARLEKREGGVFHTLGVTAVADDPTSTALINVDVEGPEIRVSVDGQKVFAAKDSAHLSGSVGLFAQAPSSFDEVAIVALSATADISLVAPVGLAVIPSGDVTVEALVQALPAGGSVQLSMPGQAPVNLNSPPWNTEFSGVASGVTSVTARLLDSGSNTVAQHVVDIAVGGDYALAIGDSITNGDGDTFAFDNDDALRIMASRAYASTLAAKLESLPPTEVVVFNEGIGGDRSDETDMLRLQSIIERHPNASSALVQLGTNDADANRTVAAVENDLQSIVTRLGNEGLTVYVSKLPPFVGPTFTLSSAENTKVSQYNNAIENNIAGALPGPDLWSFFAPDDDADGVADRLRTDLFADPVHPNALGHAVIACLWYNVLLGNATGTAIDPFVLDLLSRPTYKQNLLEAGDQYLVDSPAVLNAVPAALRDAVWVMTAQSDATDSSSSFVSFALDRNATVYVAYDTDATMLPDWLNPATSSFIDTGLTLQTSQTDYRIFSLTAGAGTITLGGNLAAGGGDATDMYLVALAGGG